MVMLHDNDVSVSLPSVFGIHDLRVPLGVGTLVYRSHKGLLCLIIRVEVSERGPKESQTEHFPLGTHN